MGNQWSRPASAYDAINRNIGRILRSIQSTTPPHVGEYDWLVENLHRLAEADYQRRYKRYWRLNGAGLSQDYCQRYFQYLQSGLDGNVLDPGTLAYELYQIPIRNNKQALQFSFCTKLCHMLNRHLPIYDSNIRTFYDFRTPGYGLTVLQRIAQFMCFYWFLIAEYNRVLEGRLLHVSIQAFRQRFRPQHFTDIKVIDSLIWGWRQVGN